MSNPETYTYRQVETALAVMDYLNEVRAVGEVYASIPRCWRRGDFIKWMDDGGAQALRLFCADIAVDIEKVWSQSLTAEARDIMVWDTEFIPAVVGSWCISGADVTWSHHDMQVAAAKMAARSAIRTHVYDVTLLW